MREHANIYNVIVSTPSGPFETTWESLEKYQVPEWYLDAKFGIFIHWGVYSVPAFGNEWYPRAMYEKGSKELWEWFVRMLHNQNLCCGGAFFRELIGPREFFLYFSIRSAIVIVAHTVMDIRSPKATLCRLVELHSSAPTKLVNYVISVFAKIQHPSCGPLDFRFPYSGGYRMHWSASILF